MIWLYLIIAAEGLLMMQLCSMILEDEEEGDELEEV